MKTFVAYVDRYDYCEEMSNDEKANLFDCIRSYTKWYDCIPLDTIKFIWNKIKKMIDEDKYKREEKSNSNRENANKRWKEYKNKDNRNANACERIPPHYDNVNVNVNVNDNDNEDVNINNNEISSKEDTAIAEYWNKEVNEIISILKEKVKESELIYSPDPQDRQYAKHLLSKKFSANLLQFWMTMEEFIGNIVKLSTQPYTKQVNNCKKFYYNRWDVINSSKSWMNKNKTTISHIW